MSGLFAGRYAIERQIGEGATAIVYLARNLDAGELVAIKVLRPSLTGSRVEDSFAREIRRTSQLDHPHILKVLAHGNHGGQLFFVVPYMEGGTLRQRMDREKQLTIVDAVGITRTIAEALDYAHRHELKLVHRDVKPENILFTSGNPCLGDFGIARALEKALGEPSSTSGVIRGTVAYMSPEQASAGSDIDGRSDIYSLGCVLYEMLAGVPTFTGPNAESILAARFAHPPRELSVYRPTVPVELEVLVHRALQFSPADRFKTAGELSRALQGVRTEPEVRPRTPRPASLVPAPPSRMSYRNRAAVVIAAAVGLAAVTLLTKTGVDKVRDHIGALQADTNHVVLLPLEREGKARERTLDDDLLHDAMSRWRGIVLVDRFQVADALRRVGAVRTNRDVVRLTISLGAARYVRGTVTPAGDGWRAYAALYDVRQSRPLFQASEHVPASVPAASAAYARLAQALLLRGSGGDVSLAGASGVDRFPRCRHSRAPSALSTTGTSHAQTRSSSRQSSSIRATDTPAPGCGSRKFGRGADYQQPAG